MRHLVERVQLPDVVPRGELVDVALQVLDRETVEHAFVGALDRGPEAIDAARVAVSPRR